MREYLPCCSSIQQQQQEHTHSTGEVSCNTSPSKFSEILSLLRMLLNITMQPILLQEAEYRGSNTACQQFALEIG